MPHMSARLRTETMDALFTGSGGFERALAWINANDDNYEKFFIAWTRGAVRSTNVELSADESVEALLSKLDAGEHAKVIDGEAA